MLRRAWIGLCLCLMMILMGSCGQTYKLLSITVTPAGAASGTKVTDLNGNSSINLEGSEAFQQLTVTASFSNGKTQDVTASSNYSIGPSPINAQGCESSPTTCVAPLEALRVNKSGMVNLLPNWSACTWDAEPTNSADTSFAYGVYPYPVTVTYTENGVTATAYLDVNVDNLAFYCYDGQKFVPPAGFPGNSAVGY